MKVLHISTPYSWRGGEHQATLLVEGLNVFGVENSVLCPNGSELAERMLRKEQQTILFRSRGVLGVNLAMKIAAICKENKFDIVHAHDAHAHTSGVIAAALFGNKVPLVISRRVDFPVSSSFFSSWKYNHPAVRKIICVSEAIRKIMIPSLKHPEVLTVVNDGIRLHDEAAMIFPATIRSELQIPSDAILVGNFSALADHKDYPTFIKAASEILKVNSRVHFIIAGRGEEEGRIKQMMQEMNLEKNIHLLGFRQDIPALMKTLDVFLMTSKTEGMGSILLEAFDIGTPVVATAAGGIPELVTDRVNGLLCPVGDVRALKDAVLFLLNNKDVAKSLAEAAKQKVKNFSFLSTAEKTLEVYKGLMY
jgi:glycosyltransferase involved in cell wall biosynthesis